MSEGFERWYEKARLALQEAEELLCRSLPLEAISRSFMAMIYAAGAALEERDGEISGWDDVVRLFQDEALPRLGLSMENRRALVIVADLYRRVVEWREMEADPLTASACLSDARSFVAETEEKVRLAQER